MFLSPPFLFFFFFNDTATTEIYTLSLHDALPICQAAQGLPAVARPAFEGQALDDAVHRVGRLQQARGLGVRDRKSTRLNSSHQIISYAVFCLKKKTKKKHMD